MSRSTCHSRKVEEGNAYRQKGKLFSVSNLNKPARQQ